MNKYLLPTLILGTLTLNGCARHSNVIIDPQGVEMATYQRDLAECQQLANQVQPHVIESVIGGAIVGAIVGEIIGGHHSRYRGGHSYRYRTMHHNNFRHTSGSSNNFNSSAQLGALGGGLIAASNGMHESDGVLKNCIANRGYRILN